MKELMTDYSHWWVMAIAFNPAMAMVAAAIIFHALCNVFRD